MVSCTWDIPLGQWHPKTGLRPCVDLPPPLSRCYCLTIAYDRWLQESKEIFALSASVKKQGTGDLPRPPVWFQAFDIQLSMNKRRLLRRKMAGVKGLEFRFSLIFASRFFQPYTRRLNSTLIAKMPSMANSTSSFRHSNSPLNSTASSTTNRSMVLKNSPRCKPTTNAKPKPALNTASSCASSTCLR
jgi:hypothetical protein